MGRQSSLIIKTVAPFARRIIGQQAFLLVPRQSQSHPILRAAAPVFWTAAGVARDQSVFHQHKVHRLDAGRNSRCVILRIEPAVLPKALSAPKSIWPALIFPDRFGPKAQCDHLDQYANPIGIKRWFRHIRRYRFQSLGLAAIALRAWEN